MAGVSNIGAAATLTQLQFDAQRFASVARLQKDAVNAAGAAALKLIQSAVVDTGRSLDLRA